MWDMATGFTLHSLKTRGETGHVPVLQDSVFLCLFHNSTISLVFLYSSTVDSHVPEPHGVCSWTCLLCVSLS